MYLKSRKFSLFLQAQLAFALNSLEIHKGFLRLFALNPACACEIFVIFFVFRYTLGRLYAVPALFILPSFLFRTDLLYQIHKRYATKTKNFIQKETPERLLAFRCLLKSNHFACKWAASLRRALSRIFSSVCSLRMCSALQASSAAVCSSTPSCTKKWVSS